MAKYLVDEVISRFGVPSYIHSDQGRQRVNCIRRSVFFWILRKQGLCLIISKVMECLKKSNRKAMNMNWSNQKANPALKTKTGNK